MKKNQTTDQTTPEWDHVRSSRERMRSHARNLPTAKILFGKAIFELKQSLGIEGRGGDRRSKGTKYLLIGEADTWEEICKRELGMTRKTADRYIARYLKALECAEDMHPQILRILRKPSREVNDEDFETLAAHVDSLVDRMTQASLRIELGITLEEDDEDAGQTDTDEGDLQTSLEQQALVFFASIPRKIDELKRAILGVRDFQNYQIFLSHLPLEDGRDGKPSLLGIKEGLEEILGAGLGNILTDIKEMAETRMHGDPVKSRRRKPTIKSRK